MMKDCEGGSIVKLGTKPLFVAGLMSSVHCVNNMRPSDWMPWRVFSMADVMTLA